VRGLGPLRITRMCWGRRGLAVFQFSIAKARHTDFARLEHTKHAVHTIGNAFAAGLHLSMLEGEGRSFAADSPPKDFSASHQRSRWEWVLVE
jgi:hypothetical protein